MKIAITTVGSRGDLQPYLALALGLQKKGFAVTIVSAKNEAEFVKSYGLDFSPLDVDIQALMESGEVAEMAKGNNPLKFIVSHLQGSKRLEQTMIKTQAEIYAACADADVIICHPGMSIGYFIAEQHQKTCIFACPFPAVATDDYPSILFYNLPKFGKWFNKATHFIFDKVFWTMGKSAIKTFWQANVKTKPNFSTSPFQQHLAKKGLVLNGYSRFLFEPSSAWTENIQTTGSWFLSQTDDFLPPTDLEDFINNGEPPIYIGFGSMKDLHHFEKTMTIIIAALKNTQQRAVVGLGWTANTYTGILPDTVFLAGNVPHSWLFPKMKIVVHHGGAGTTAAGLLAGKPTIIIPHNADQPAWGKRIFELGLGAKPIPKPKLNTENLTEAIIFAMQDAIKINAEILGKKMQQENGVEKAVELISALENNL